MHKFKQINSVVTTDDIGVYTTTTTVTVWELILMHYFDKFSKEWLSKLITTMITLQKQVHIIFPPNIALQKMFSTSYSSNSIFFATPPTPHTPFLN